MVLLFVFAAGLAATALLVITKVVDRVVNQGCRYRCTCVDDSAALGALASIVENPRFNHDR